MCFGKVVILFPYCIVTIKFALILFQFASGAFQFREAAAVGLGRTFASFDVVIFQF